MSAETIQTLKDLLSSKAIAPNTRAFLQSLSDQYEKAGVLSEKQWDAIQTVQERYERREKEAEDFEYTPEKKARAIICAKYYRNTSYFTQLADNVLMDEDFNPVEIFAAERETIMDAIEESRSSNRSKRGVMSVARFKAIATLVWTPDDGLLDNGIWTKE